MPKPFKQLSPRAILVATFILFSVPLLLIGLFPSRLDTFVDRNTYLVFHNITEFFSIMVCLSVFSVGWFTYDQSKDRHALFLSAVFLAVGLLDFMHTMSNAAMPAFLTPNSTNKSTQFWIVSRLLDSFAFLGSAYIYHDSRSVWLSKKALLASALIVTGLVFTGVVFFPEHIPVTAVPGIGLTPLKRYLEILVILMLAWATVAYWNRMTRTGDRSLVYYPAAFIICIFGEAVFASYKTGFDSYNVLGHIYKVIAFILIYKGIFIAAVQAPYRKLADEERTRHLASFPQFNPNPVLEVDRHGKISFCNPAAHIVLKNYGMEEVSCAIFLPPDMDRILLDLAAKKEIARSCEIVVGERIFQLNVHTLPLFGVIRLYAHDITEHKKAELALQENEKHMRLVLQASSTGTFEYDLITGKGRWNLTEFELLGLKPGDVDPGPETFFHYVHPEDVLQAQASWEKALRDGKLDTEFRIVRTDGQVRWLASKGDIVSEKTLEKDSPEISSNVLRFLGVNYDITERKQAEEDLQKVAARLNLLAETADRLLMSDSPQEIVDSLCQKVMAFLDCQVFFNFLVDEKEGKLHLNACAGIPEEEKKRIEWLDYGVAVCGCVARDASRIVAENIPETPDLRTDLVRGYGIRAYACHPLMLQGRVLGTLSFGTRARNRFSDDDLSLMKVVADQVSIAMQRKHADKELRQAHDELEKRVMERTMELSATVEIMLEAIAVREEAEISLRRLNRLYSMLCETNQAIVRVENRSSLFNDFCRIAVEQGGFLLAWIGQLDEENGQLRSVAAFGATGYLDNIHLCANDESAGNGPTGTTIRQGSYHICNDFLNDHSTGPWHSKGLEHGFKASASVALKEEGQVIGALNLYAGEKDFFDRQHVELIVQMGGDISFALDNLAREERSKVAEQALLGETVERLQTLEDLREKEQMLLQQSRLAAMGDMINNIAHQWRQPLNVMGLLVQQMQLFYNMGLFDKKFLDESVNKSMDLINHMSRTIDDFRNFFKPDKDKITFAVCDVVNKTVSLIEDGFKNQQITIDLQADANPVVCGFPNEYSQALLNILVNARDALLERRSGNAKVTITIRRKEEKAVVTITDNAGGIPEEIIDKIFDPYFTTKGPEYGTGVGLYMSKAIIEKNMNGRLTARNTAEGAEFRIEV